MTPRHLALKTLLLAVTCAALYTAAVSQAQEQTATQFYQAYKAAFTKAKTIDELLPFMTKAKVDEISQLPKADWPKAFEMIKDFYVFSNEKVVKETATATGATLNVEAIDPDKKKYKATVTLLREGGAWKFSEEDWSPTP